MMRSNRASDANGHGCVVCMQCGFCTPGWVASMYGLLLQKGTQLSAQEVRAL